MRFDHEELSHHGLQMAKVILLSLVTKPPTPEPEGHGILSRTVC